MSDLVQVMETLWIRLVPGIHWMNFWLGITDDNINIYDRLTSEHTIDY